SVSDAFVKAAREALVNAAKHAGPCRVSVKLEVSRRGRLVLTVADDGIGSRSAEARPPHRPAAPRPPFPPPGGRRAVSPAPRGATASVAIDTPGPAVIDGLGGVTTTGTRRETAAA